MTAATAPAVGPARSDARPPIPSLDADRDPPRDRSRQIIDAAYELLADEGLEGLTIRAVLKRTGLSRRAFYERFSGKDDLVLGVFEQTVRLAAVHYGQEVRTLADPLKRLELIVTSIALGRSSPDAGETEQDNRRGAALSREHLRLAEARPNDLQAALKPLIGLIAQQLSDGMEAGLVRDCDPERLAALVYNLVSTTVHTELLTQETVQPGRAPPPQLAADIWEFCRRAIAAYDPPPQGEVARRVGGGFHSDADEV